MSNDVFISCSHLNEAFAEQLDKALRNAGLQVQLSLDASNASSSVDGKVMIVVASSPTLRSGVVQAQIEAASRAGVPIIAAQFGSIKARPESLNQALWLDERKDQSDENLAAIVAATKAQLDAMDAEAESEKKAVVAPEINVESPSNANGKHDVFISYSTKDTNKALEVRDFFEANGLACWMAPRDIEGASNYNRAIPDAIDTAVLLVVLLSPQSDASGWVLKEVNRADTRANKREMRVYPIVIEPVNLYEMEMVLSLYQSKELEQEGLGAITARAKVIVNEMRKQKDIRPIEETTSLKSQPLLQSQPLPKSRPKALLQKALDELDESDLQGDQDVLHTAILSGGNDIDAKDSMGRTALHWLCSSGPKTEQELVVLRQLLTLKPAVNAVAEIAAPDDPEELFADSTPLHCAAMYEDVTAARLLLINGAKPNEQNSEGKTPWEVSYDDDVDHLLQFFVDGQLDFFDNPLVKSEANSSLAQNLERRPYQTERILNTVVGGADDFDLRDALGRNILHWAAWKNEPELCDILLRRGADIGVTDNAGNTPLRLAFKSNALEAEKMLLQWAEERSLGIEALEGGKSRVISVEVTEVTKANEDLETALLSKSPQKAKKIFQAIRGGATDLTAADDKGRTALHWAVSKNELEMVKILLQGGGNVDAKTISHGETPLHFAAERNFAEVATELIAHGASLEAEHTHGTALMSAATYGATEVAHVLIDAGANVNAKQGGTDYTALHKVAEKDQDRVAKILIEAGADVNAKSSQEFESQTPLHLMAFWNSVDCARLLLAAGANKSFRDKDGNMPQDVAELEGNDDILELLEASGAE